MRSVASVPSACMYLALLGGAMISGIPTQFSFTHRLDSHGLHSHQARARRPEVSVRSALGRASWRCVWGSSPAETPAFFGERGWSSRACGCDRRALARENLQNAGGACNCGSGLRTRYGLPRDEAATRCAMCKSDKMIDFSIRACTCGIRASHGHRGDPHPTCCAKCRELGMVDLYNKLCPCGRSPVFGYKEDARRTCCATCRSPGMVNIKGPRCSCGRQPEFGLAGTLFATHCQDCHVAGMLKIISLKCEACGIKGRLPAFGLPDDAEPRFCSACKTDGMLNFKLLRQLEEGAANKVRASLSTRKGT
mmetsp:Transcript_97023/g.312657  ORF Transcript_97023/g.312657 Transcript_97023/m.312657 type:complete len:308 (-) Transcript_97023:145-1068(-)